MTTEENKKLDMQWLETMNRRDISALDKLADEIYAPDFVSHNPSFPSLYQGLEGMKQWMRQVFKDLPDFHIAMEDFIAEGDKVVCYGTITGTNATTGEPFNMQFIHISRYAGGKIVEEWEIDVAVPVMTKSEA
jgi:predicted ester cyclase